MINPNPRPWFAASLALALTVAAVAADQPGNAEKPATVEKADTAFGKDVQLAPFVVNGRKLSISIHARTKSDRTYAEKFADEVVEIAYETIGESTGKGLVIVGREGEPHPLVVFRKFQALAAAGQLDPAVAARSAELTAMMTAWRAQFHLDEGEGKTGEKIEIEDEARAPARKANKGRNVEFKVTLDMVMPALPLPLEGLLSKLYQFSWAEGFDEARIERKLRSLTVADLESNALSKYDWVFYLPPRKAFGDVMDDLIRQFVKEQKIGLLKRAALRSALFVFSPAIKTAIEGMRKSVLYMTVLRAEGHYSHDDIIALTGAYAEVLMPDFKFNGGTEHKRALEAIEREKIKNAEYAKDPFVKLERLATFDPADYAPFEGEYTQEAGKVTHRFKPAGESFSWQYKDDKPMVFYPAGERLLVKDDGSKTIRFLLDEKGAVTGVEERWVRVRQTIPRKF